MDAATLYLIVKTASGDARVILKTPLHPGQTCERAKVDTHAYILMVEQFKAGAKPIILFCTGAAPP